MHRRWRQPRWNIRAGGKGDRTEVAEAEVEAEAKAAKVEVEGCFRGSGMHQRHWNALKEHRGGWS
jgi:hypothetical protein